MTRNKERGTTTIVWWENLPKDFIEWSDREMEKADKRWAEEDKKAQKKGEKKKGVIVPQEDEGNADWLKRPSDLIASLNDPKIQTRKELLSYLEKEGLTETLLYRRMKDDPKFW